MKGDRYTIGQVARRTGLSVRKVRFYADNGVVEPVQRSEAGYRLYDGAGMQRLELVRTLRELGFDLPTIRRVLEREVTVTEVAVAHAELLDDQIRTLALRRSVVRAIARNARDTEEMTLMTKLAQMSDEERQKIIDDFFDHVFGGLEIDPAFEDRLRTARPNLPDDPSPEQVEAWVELAELVQDDDFRASIRRMSEGQAQEIAERRDPGEQDWHANAQDWQRLSERVLELAGAALEAGVDPESERGGTIVDELAPEFAAVGGEQDGPGYRARLADRVVQGSDPRAERYWQLLATINGWPPVPTATPAWEWFGAALRAAV